jgi:hypothetical protein
MKTDPMVGLLGKKCDKKPNFYITLVKKISNRCPKIFG